MSDEAGEGYLEAHGFRPFGLNLNVLNDADGRMPRHLGAINRAPNRWFSWLIRPVLEGLAGQGASPGGVARALAAGELIAQTWFYMLPDGTRPEDRLERGPSRAVLLGGGGR